MFYNFVINPIVLLYKWLYLSLFDLTGSYGISLLLMSVITFLVTSPFMRWAGRIQKNEKHIQDILKPQIDTIRSQSQGAEQHRRIANLYKSYAYHPAMAVRSVAGLAVQIPFLIAAYYMLSELPDIKGQSFLIINDLSKPDGLIGSINVLPILMTVINLMSACTTAAFARKDKLQAALIAFLFLLLLYTAPSALLIFWTCNNLWGLLLNICPNALSIKIKPELYLMNIARLIYNNLNMHPNITAIISVIVTALEPGLYLYFHNASEAKLLDIASVSIYFTLGSIFTLLILTLLLNNITKSALITNITILFFLNYAIIEKIYFKIFDSLYYWHVVYICTVFIVICGYYIHTKINAKIAAKINLLILAIFTTTIVFSFLLATPILYRKTTEQLTKTSQTNLFESFQKQNNYDKLSNVYMFIFDEYAGYECLKHYCSYDNTPFLNMLSYLGFNISRSSYGKEINTLGEVPYLLNIGMIKTKGMSKTELESLLVNPYLYQLMKKNGYKINIADAHLFLDSINSDKSFLELQKNKLMSDITQSAKYIITKKTLLYPFINKNINQEVINIRNLIEYSKNSVIPISPKDRWFTLNYFYLPHPPYRFDANGNPVSAEDRTNHSDPGIYLNQLKYVNLIIEDIVSHILQNDPNSVIILLSDHGYRPSLHLRLVSKIIVEVNERDYKLMKNILCAVYYKGEKLDIEGMSGVNVLRLVLNKLLNYDFDFNID